VLRSVARFLEHRLKLKINYEKSRIVKSDDYEYLGFIFKNKRDIWSDESLENFKYNIRRLTARSGAYQWMIGWKGYPVTSVVGRHIMLCQSTTARFLRLMNGFADVFACATLNNGAGVGHESATSSTLGR
jgi:hypothetical protein